MKTKITTASVRIALSHQYSTFEVALNLENPEGINETDIKTARVTAQSLANEAVNEYKNLPNSNPKIELQRVEQKIKDIKKMVESKEPEKFDPEEIAKVEALPLYQGKTSAKKAKA